MGVPHSENVKLVEFTPGKTAFEIPFEGGELIVDNPFPSLRQFYISFMATGPIDTIYSDAEITVISSNRASQKVIIHPLATEFNHPVRLSIMRPVGLIDSGRNVVHFKPLNATLYPFL